MLAVVLSGCDLRERIPLTPKDVLRMADPFGVATRERLSSDENGDTYVYLVESKRGGSWSAAEMAIYRHHNGLCPEGQRPSIQARSPELLSQSPAARNVSHPAGTTYRLVVLCPAQPYDEVDFEPGISRRDAEKQIFDALTGGVHRPGRYTHAVSLPTSPWNQKYEWMNGMIGLEVSRQLPVCPEGVVVRRVLIGNYAEGHQPGKEADERPEFVFGLLTECAGGPGPDAQAKGDTSRPE